jgi:8-oxo-dGTP diphosphatase
MEGSYCYRHPRPAITTDSVVFGFDGENLNVLLIKRRNDPFAKMFALPGGFLDQEEEVEDCARRELQEETGVYGLKLRNCGVLSDVGRDPRERVISLCYFGLMGPSAMMSDEIAAGSDAGDVKWVGLDKILNGTVKLAFDHVNAVKMACRTLSGALNKEPVAFELLDEKFTIKQLQKVYESILNRSFDRANFHKKMVGDSSAQSKMKKNGRKKNLGILSDTGLVMQDTKHKPAKYYTLDRERYDALMATEDFNFGF